MARGKEEKFISGTITSANDKGVKLDGGESWFNYSKWADGLPILEKGDRVELRLEGDFIMGAKIGGQPDNGPRPSATRTVSPRNAAPPAWGDDPGPTPPEFERAMEKQSSMNRGAAPAHTDKDALIVRQVALKAAVDWLKADGSNLDDLFDTAQQMYAWVMGGAR